MQDTPVLDGEIYEAIEYPPLPVKLVKVPKRKTAMARIRGIEIEVTIPKHWPKDYQKDVAEQLSRQIQRQFIRDCQLINEAMGPRLTFTDKKQLVAWIEDLNSRTLNVPLKGVRMGYSKYSHLAQMNLKTHVMTVSKHCLQQVPESALRYLILHELAHILVPNHSKAFWDYVKRFVPDLKHQRNLISAVHRIRIYEAELQALKTAPATKPPSTTALTPAEIPDPVDEKKPKGFLQQLRLFDIFDIRQH